MSGNETMRPSEYSRSCSNFTNGLLARHIFALPVIRPESGPDPVAETVGAIAYQQRDFFMASVLGSMGWFPAVEPICSIACHLQLNTKSILPLRYS
jgi:hypothetical protein